MKKRNLLLIVLILFSCLFFIHINKTKLGNPIQPILGKPSYSSKIGSIHIKSIGLYQNLYEISSSDNQVDKSVTILYHDENLTILAAHSGDGINAYFRHLEELKLGDLIKIELYQSKNNYVVTKIETVKKTGSIRIPKKDDPTIILTTCGNNSDEQLNITAKKVNP